MTTTPHDPLDPLDTPGRPLGQSVPSTPASAPTGEYGDSSSTSSTAQAAKDEAKNVKDAAADATQQVAGTAKEQAGQVVSDVREQTRQLADETRQQLSSQAVGQRDKAVSSLRSLGEELRSMSDQSAQSGLGTQLAREGSELTQKVADFVEQREPAQLLDEVRTFARRKPGAFLIGAAVAGVVVGRLTRGAVAAQSSDDTGSGSYPSGGGYPRATPSSYVGAQGDPVAFGDDSDLTPGYGSQQMDQLAFPAATAQYPAEPGLSAGTETYAPEEPGPYDTVADQPPTAFPPEQGYRP
ncbi:MAG: hypothetical protein H0V07_04820 [Propionibacteriales bacterium]|nr:hypothetical protein [Propionibacteriales bacterium]